MATNGNPNVADAARELFDGVTLYKDVGLDSEGRSHHYDEKSGEVVVCKTDRRGLGMYDDDIARRMSGSGDRDIQDYVRFVRDEVEGLEWAELDVSEGR